ncbi:HAD family hydrolase [Paenibacillus thermotolerans]|uniref:HAD family hydrolase n=1 Tax=Paenibacillus thermotolerans TaxID=3027807 RepID=UPI00236792C7|nr:MULTISPECIES: Cof-type HAD-IIB family hydrolase [unclassified Paenibacillus]
MRYKLVALDLDGTLLGNDKQISDANAEAVNDAIKAGAAVILATGRPIREIRPYAEKLRLNGPIVANNGSEVWRTPDVLYARREIPAEHVGRIFAFLEKYDEDVAFWAHTAEGLIEKENKPQQTGGHTWLQFALRSEKPELLEEIRRELHAWNVFELSSSHVTNVECNPMGVSKATGLAEICKLLHIDRSETVCIGDGLNDIPMLRFADLGVAMGNAQEPVKRAAKLIAPSNVEDGVADVIRRVVL